MIRHIYFITGASGTGKTSLVSELKNKYENKEWSFLHFDSIGIPSSEEMIQQSGSLENWQRDTTFEWIKNMLDDYKEKDIIIFEGQVDIKFIKDGFSQHNFSNYDIILMDCDEYTMEKRLRENMDE